MELKAVACETRDGIAEIRLNRPHRMNAWTGRMHTEYLYCLARADEDPDVGCILVTGEGRGFCVGGDSEALSGHARRGAYDSGTDAGLMKPGYGTRPEFDATLACHFGLKKPVAAAINGPAAGIGLALACFADLRFACRGVKLTTAHGRLNLPAEYGLSWMLPRLIGLTRANDLLFSSRVILTDEAYEMGLINQLHDAEELLPKTRAFLRNMLETVAPGSLLATKRQVYADLHRDLASAVMDSEARLAKMMRTPDFREGVAALTEKRRPRWTGDFGADTEETGR